MLVLTRKPTQQIRVGDAIIITVVRVEGNKVRIGIEAPLDVPIMRGEIAASEPVEPTSPGLG